MKVMVIFKRLFTLRLMRRQSAAIRSLLLAIADLFPPCAASFDGLREDASSHTPNLPVTYPFTPEMGSAVH